MARPSFRRRRLAGESGGGRDGYLCAWHRPRQERLQRGWAGCVWCGCDASQGEAGDADCSGGEASSVRCRDGGLLRGSSSRPPVRRPRPRCPADVARICPALHQGAEERRSRRRGDRGGDDPADDALCRTEEPGRMVVLVEDARVQWAELDRRIAAFDAEFVRWAKENEEASRLTTIPGFGPIIASALVAAVGRAESFDHGRDLTAWLGLVPRQ